MSEGKWVTLPPMTTKRAHCAAVAVGNKIYVMGGTNESKRCLSSVEVFDTSTRTWTVFPDMITPRTECAAATIDDKIYVCGGLTKPKSDYECEYGEVVNISTRSWTLLPSMQKSRRGCAAGAIRDELFVVGGCYGGYSEPALEIYDTVTEALNYRDDMEEDHFGCAATTVGDTLYVFGGTSQVEVRSFNVLKNTWTFLPNMTQKRNGYAVVGIKDKIYVFGGSSGSKYHYQCEVFDTFTHQWSFIPNMNQARHGCAGVAIGDKLYVIGGMSNNAYLASIEVFHIPPTTSIPAEVVSTKKGSYSVGVQVEETPNDPNINIQSTNKVLEASQKDDLSRESTHSPSKSFFKRVIYLEDQLDLKDVPSVFHQRIDNLELNILGEARHNSGSVIQRIKVLEDALFG